jgi:hypothetical protein
MSTSIKPRELENAGTREFKKIIKLLLDKGFEYKDSAPAVFPQPSKGTYVAYENINIEAYNNWQDNNRNDSHILLIFKPVKHKTEIPQEILSLGYKHYVFDKEYEETIWDSPGDSVAKFEKKILGTELVEKTREDGKKVKVVDTKAVKGVLTVIVQYDSDFDHQNANKYYKKVKYGSDEDDFEYDHRDKHNTGAARKFMISVIRELKESHSGGKTKRKSKRIKNKRKSVKNYSF